MISWKYWVGMVITVTYLGAIAAELGCRSVGIQSPSHGPRKVQLSSSENAASPGQVSDVQNLKGEKVAFRDGQNSITLQGRYNDGREINIVVQRAKYDNSSPYPLWYWGSGGMSRPRYLVSNIDVKVDGANAWMRLSAFSDLADPNFARLEVTDDSATLVIDGSETGEHYFAMLVFRGDHLVRRKVWNPIFAAQAWEETNYSYVTDN